MELLVALEYDRALRRERTFRDPLDLLHISDEHLLRHYRFPRQEIVRLCKKMEPLIGRLTRSSHAVPTHTQILVALRFFANGSFLSDVEDATGLSQSSVSRIIDNVTDALYRKSIIDINMPTSTSDIIKVKHGFRQIMDFPNIVGAIGGTRIPITAPTVDESLNLNKKDAHSLKIQVVCDSQNYILDFVNKYPGSTQDSFIWNNCFLRSSFEEGDFGNSHLVGDSGYPLEPFLLTPFAQPSTPAEERYNRSLMMTRVVVEQTIALLKSRFRCLHKCAGSLRYKPSKCCKIAAACMLLHNYCVKWRIPFNDIIKEEEEKDLKGPDEIPVPVGSGDAAGQAKRKEIVQNYFS